MRWLVHGKMSEEVGNALRRHGHSVQLLDDPPQSASELLALAHEKQLDVLSCDASLMAALDRSCTRFDRSIVFLQLGGGDIAQSEAIDRLFERYKRLTPARIYTVTASRVKIRQLPGAGKARQEKSVR